MELHPLSHLSRRPRPAFLSGPLSLACLRGGANLLIILALSSLWSFTTPVLSYFSYRKVTSDINLYIDPAAGLYIFSALTSFFLLTDNLPQPISGICGVILGITETVLLVPIVFQAVYFILYGSAVDDAGMQALIDTNVNEIIEFVKTSPILNVLSVAVLLILCTGGFLAVNLYASGQAVSQPPYVMAAEAAVLAVALYLLFGKRKGAFYRTDLIRRYMDNSDYRKSTLQYKDRREELLRNLKVKQLGGVPGRPHTFLLVIGESASRDYMSAFNTLDRDTTPWMSEMARESRHNVLIRNSYSCAFQTVPALERALTEKNQYNDIEFPDACSIIDIARSLGYKISWFSNQGHIGVADTSVSLVAETSDTALWTAQQVGKLMYDESLLPMLETVSPDDNNLVVLHLKGSHFSFINRYPPEATVWGTPGVEDRIVNYMNSIHYTDSILRRAYEYAKEKLNLQAMVYFSDHAAIPDKRRSPRFDGFGQCRIPLFIHMTDEYIANHPSRHSALTENRDRFFTNDLAYELVCGLLDVESDRFDESASLASKSYRFGPEDLLTYTGQVRISDDPNI